MVNLIEILQNKEKSIALKTMEDGQVMLYSVSCSLQLIVSTYNDYNNYKSNSPVASNLIFNIVSNNYDTCTFFFLHV